MTDIVVKVRDQLGPTLTSFIAGIKSTRFLADWADGRISDPPDARERLTVADQVFTIIAEADGPDVARAWFMGMNPWLNDNAPALAIRNGKFDAVLAAAKAHAQDAWY